MEFRPAAGDLTQIDICFSRFSGSINSWRGELPDIYIETGVVLAKDISLLKLPSGWISTSASDISPLALSHDTRVMVLDMPGRKSSNLPFKVALPYSMTGFGRAVSLSALWITASFGSTNFGRLLPFNWIPQILNPFSTSAPSVKSMDVTDAGRGGNTN